MNKCDKCDGTGEVSVDGNLISVLPCDKCDGDGVVSGE